MGRCVACNKQINFGDDLCKRCQDAVASVYKATQEDVDLVESILYNVKDCYIINGVLVERDELPEYCEDI